MDSTAAFACGGLLDDFPIPAETIVDADEWDGPEALTRIITGNYMSDATRSESRVGKNSRRCSSKKSTRRSAASPGSRLSIKVQSSS